MPVKSRLIENEIKETAHRKRQFGNELKEAILELERLQSSVVKGTADTDALIASQLKVNVIEQTINTFDSRLDALDADLIAYRNLEKRKEIFSKIKLLDEEAEKAGRRFTDLYADVEQLSYARFAEMASIIANIEKLKAEFGQHIANLIPDASKLKNRILPEVENELNNLIAELQSNDCKLRVLRAVGLSLRREYATDDENAFCLPDNALDVWIWVSIRAVREREQQKQQQQRDFAAVEKTGLFQRIFS